MLQGLNETRVSKGMPALSTSGDLNALAQAHAKAMAEAGSKFHSSLGMVESVMEGSEAAMVAVGVGARSAAHLLHGRA